MRRGGENIKQSVPRSQGTPLFFYRESNLFRTLQRFTWTWPKVEQAAEEGNQVGEQRKQGNQKEEGEKLQSPSLLRAPFARLAPETFDVSICQDDDC